VVAAPARTSGRNAAVTVSAAGRRPSIRDPPVGAEVPTATQRQLDHPQERGATEDMIAAIRGAGRDPFPAPQEPIDVVPGA
jgi:hypothetical protein